MFGQFLSNLLAPDPEPLPGEDCRLALAALLVRVARADRTYSEPEMDRITRILQTRYGLGPFEAAALRAKAELLEEQAPDTVRFTRAINLARWAPVTSLRNSVSLPTITALTTSGLALAAAISRLISLSVSAGWAWRCAIRR